MPRRLFPFFLAASAMMFASVAFGSSSRKLPTGEFEDVEGPGGNLVISSDDKGKMVFRLVANGVNGHTCGLEGNIEGSQGRTESLGDVGACSIHFKTGRSTITLVVGDSQDNFEACRAWCGMRASFDRVYTKVPTGCTATERQARYSASKQAMDAQDSQRAIDGWKRLQRECDRYFELIERDTIHNDLASVLHHLDKNRECLRELSATLASSVGNEAALKDNFYGEPMDFEAYLPTARAAWQLGEICSGTH